MDKQRIEDLKKQLMNAYKNIRWFKEYFKHLEYKDYNMSSDYDIKRIFNIKSDLHKYQNTQQRWNIRKEKIILRDLIKQNEDCSKVIKKRL